MDEDTQTRRTDLTLPASARLPINRCNLPSVILGSLTFQKHPAPLQIDGVHALHGDFFRQLDAVEEPAERADIFKEYMRASFFLDRPDEIGLQVEKQRLQRNRANYLRMLRGWMFDPDGQEAAVLKSWVESRFGLLPRNHQGPLDDYSGENYQAYLAARSQGLYNANALESQLDLLYSYCQYEVKRQHPAQRHIRLYRGTNRLDEYEILQQLRRTSYVLVLNNLNSFTDERERADEFGDYIIEVEVPSAKLVYFPGLLPGALKGEKEYLVIGGVYEVSAGVL